MTLWGGCFDKAPDNLLRQFGDSLPFDWRLYEADIAGSCAYAAALHRAGLIPLAERDELLSGLRRVEEEFRSGQFSPTSTDEDIHTAVERRLGELVGPVAGKLHTGRSRNDQVSTDLRLYLLGKLAVLEKGLDGLQTALLDKAEEHLDAVMPGYTHLQQAQPVLFSHWLLSFYWKLERDRERLVGVRHRTATLPLGSGALAGCPFPLDRHVLASELGFQTVSQNSIDAVSDRDFCIEFLAWAAQVQLHLSSLAEDVVLWATREFGFLRLDDAYSTGSSLMPQKKNPDVFELVRGKSARMIAHLTSALVTVKGLPSGYNKDLQEDKEPLFDAVDTLELELPLVSQVIASMTVNADRMRAAMDPGMLATDLADYLVGRGVPFREAHHLVGRAVRRAAELGVSVSQLAPAELESIHPALGSNALQSLSFRASVERRSIEGGTATSSVRAQIEQARRRLSQA